MNYATQAARDILGKIERDPAEVRHWRQLLILCFDQKDVETLQTLQSVLSGIEQIWNSRRQKAKEAHEVARIKQRATGSKESLPSLAVLSISLTARQKESLVKLSQTPENPALLYRFGQQLEEEFYLPEAAHVVYERALALRPEDERVEQKIIEALKRQQAVPGSGPKTVHNIGGVISPEPMGVKSPSHQRPSTASLFRRSGRLSVDRGRIALPGPLKDEEWAELQKKLEETMVQLQEHAARICETAPRPMRLPRSIAPIQWIEFLEEHLTMMLVTLDAQHVTINLTTDPDEADANNVKARAEVILKMMAEIDQALSALRAPVRPVTGPLHAASGTTPVETIFEEIDRGDFTGAERDLRGLDRESVPPEQLSEVWFYLGLAYQNDQQGKSAIVAYQRACDLNETNLEAWFNSGMIMHEEGMLRPAHDCYVHAADIDPEQPKTWCNLGVLQFQLGEFEASVSSLNKAVRLKPDYARAWDNLAGSLCAIDELAEAERCCHRAINFKSDYPDPQFKLGSIYFQQGRLEEAERAFRKVLDTQAAYPLAGHYLAMILARTQRLPEAVSLCETAAVPAGETELPSLAWNEMAFHLYETGDYTAALHAYEKALTFTPDRAVIWLDAGSTLHQLGQKDEARTHYEQAIDLDPELARAWHNLGTVRHDLGDAPGARAAFEEAERLLAAKH